MKHYFQRLITESAVSPEEIEGIIQLPVLAIVPHLERRKAERQGKANISRKINPEGRWRSRLVTSFPAPSPIYETYSNMLRAIMDVNATEARLLFFSSAVGSEGTTLTSLNLAIVAAQLGIPTLVVEAHNRASRIANVFQVSNEPGISGALAGGVKLQEAVAASSVPDLTFLPAGRSVAYPQRLWESEGFDNLLKQMRETYRLVIFEGAPITLYPETGFLAHKLDAAVLVHHFGRVGTDILQRASEKLKAHQKNILGVVLNDVA